MAEIWLAHMISRPVGAGGAMPWYSQIWVDQLALFYQEAYYAHHHYWPRGFLGPPTVMIGIELKARTAQKTTGFIFFTSYEQKRKNKNR